MSEALEVLEQLHAVTEGKLTANKIHAVIRKEIGQASSKYAPSQKIDRSTYTINSAYQGVFGMLTTQNYIEQICSALDNAGIKYDATKKDKGMLLIPRAQ